MNIYVYAHINIYRFRLSQSLAQHRTTTLAMLNHCFQLLKLVTQKHLTKNVPYYYAGLCRIRIDLLL